MTRARLQRQDVNNITSKGKKRSLDIICSPKNKKVKIVPPVQITPNWSNWISATSTKAFFLKEPLVDWLKYHSQSFISKNSKYCESVIQALRNDNEDPMNFTSFVMKKGNQFEEKIFEMLKKKFKNEYVDIGGDRFNVRSYDKFQETVDKIIDGTPIIFSGVLWDEDNHTYGIPDILVRSDYIKRFITISPISDTDSIIKAPNLNGTYHYVVIDVKFSTLKLRADGTHMLNVGMVPCYKSQTFIYNRILAKIQGYDPQKTFLLGRRWKYTTKGDEYSGDSCFDRLGTINFKTVDEDYPQLTDAGIKWVRDVRENGGEWCPLNGKHPKLFPNMSNHYDFPWSDIKKKIADEIKEITTLWRCNIKHRQTIHAKGIYKWSDPRCTTLNLGINSPVMKKVLDKMLLINQQSIIDINPPYIKNNIGNWKTKYDLEFFVDFETINDVVLSDFEKLPRSKSITLLIQIGIGWKDHSNSWNYKSFVAKDFNEEEEKKICKEFINFINKQRKKYSFKGHPPIFHWSPAEPSRWESIIEKYNNSLELDLIGSWVDMFKVFKAEPIVLRGVFDFSLKSISKAMHSYGMISTVWDTSSGNVSDGATSMLAALGALKESKRLNIPIDKTAFMKNIEKYNEVDCKVINEIVEYLRNNNI